MEPLHSVLQKIFELQLSPPEKALNLLPFGDLGFKGGRFLLQCADLAKALVNTGQCGVTVGRNDA